MPAKYFHGKNRETNAEKSNDAVVALWTKPPHRTDLRRFALAEGQPDNELRTPTEEKLIEGLRDNPGLRIADLCSLTGYGDRAVAAVLAALTATRTVIDVSPDAEATSLAWRGFCQRTLEAVSERDFVTIAEVRRRLGETGNADVKTALEFLVTRGLVNEVVQGTQLLYTLQNSCGGDEPVWEIVVNAVRSGPKTIDTLMERTGITGERARQLVNLMLRDSLAKRIEAEGAVFLVDATLTDADIQLELSQATRSRSLGATELKKPRRTGRVRLPNETQSQALAAAKALNEQRVLAVLRAKPDSAPAFIAKQTGINERYVESLLWQLRQKGLLPPGAVGRFPIEDGTIMGLMLATGIKYGAFTIDEVVAYVETSKVQVSGSFRGKFHNHVQTLMTVGYIDGRKFGRHTTYRPTGLLMQHHGGRDFGFPNV